MAVALEVLLEDVPLQEVVFHAHGINNKKGNYRSLPFGSGLEIFHDFFVMGQYRG